VTTSPERFIADLAPLTGYRASFVKTGAQADPSP